MDWTKRIISKESLLPYRTEDLDGLAGDVAALIEQQKNTWPLLRNGYDAYLRIETKRVRLDQAEVVVQHNPRRVQSTGAAVDAASIQARPCFLCPQNLPAEEKGIAYSDDYVILCNPFPVLDQHLSIVHRSHIPQQIDGNVELLLKLACDFGPGFFVLYNGPRCGASAPDHLHFQACSRALLPVEANLFDGENILNEDCSYCEDAALQAFELFTLGGCGRSVVVLRGGDSSEVASWSYRVIEELAVHSNHTEPMLNLICTYDHRMWTVYLFPRSNHRPQSYYSQGEDRLVVSPGAIDMAGVIVVPERAHFDRIGEAQIAKIFSEVSINADLVNELIDALCSSPASEDQW